MLKNKFSSVQLSLVLMFCVSIIALGIGGDGPTKINDIYIRTYLMWANATIGALWLINIFMVSMEETEQQAQEKAAKEKSLEKN